nr:MAG TPA: hypothetical protein [Caudoviricetes sp.]
MTKTLFYSNIQSLIAHTFKEGPFDRFSSVEDVKEYLIDKIEKRIPSTSTLVNHCTEYFDLQVASEKYEKHFPIVFSCLYFVNLNNLSYSAFISALTWDNQQNFKQTMKQFRATLVADELAGIPYETLERLCSIKDKANALFKASTTRA